MAVQYHIRNPIEWGWHQVKGAGHAMGSAAHAVEGGAEARNAPLAVRRITVADLGVALAKGVKDFGACRTDVIFICLIYPVMGLLLAQIAFGNDFLPLVFPLGAGFALVGPVAAIGLYEMSRLREQGLAASWADAFAVMRAPSFGAILTLGLLLLAIFLLWQGAAYGIYMATLGPQPPASVGGFLRDVFTTDAGGIMIVAGMAAGFVFALAVLMIGAISFPLLLDRDVGLLTAVMTSVRAFRANPVPMSLWGLVVAGGLVLGTIPALLGLVIVIPVLGHATWHLYRALVPR
ncbi:MAG: DUF2189 domain-containing protein [Alphaproteobacteria bacterium]